MKFGKNVFTETKYTDGYYKISIQRYNEAVQCATIETPEDVLVVKTVKKLQDLAELLDGLLRDWEEKGSNCGENGPIIQ